MKYIDSSAFIKYYSDESAEKGADKMKVIIDRAKDGKEVLISSVLLIGEVISAFDKWVRLKILTKEQMSEVISEFVNDIKDLTEVNSIILEDVNSINIIFAVDYIINYHMTVNDAIHLYTALINGNRIDEFVSSDNNLNAVAEKEGLKIFNPEE